MDYESIMMSILLDSGDKNNVLDYYEKKYDEIKNWDVKNMKGVKITEKTLDNIRTRNIMELNLAFQKVYKIHI